MCLCSVRAARAPTFQPARTLQKLGEDLGLHFHPLFRISEKFGDIDREFVQEPLDLGVRTAYRSQKTLQVLRPFGVDHTQYPALKLVLLVKVEIQTGSAFNLTVEFVPIFCSRRHLSTSRKWWPPRHAQSRGSDTRPRSLPAL